MDGRGRRLVGTVLLYLGDSSGANDGTTPEKRPTSLDMATPLRRQ